MKLSRNYCWFIRRYFSNNCKLDNVRVRYAPSPTGMLHLGGLRTALYNYLFAKNHGGSFILRIEDTDRSRVIPNAVENMSASLKWCGIVPDEGTLVGGPVGPYSQSERLDIYQSKVKQLIESEKAYYCFCTEKRLAILRKHAISSGQVPQYDNKCRSLTKEIVDMKLKQNEPYVIRFKLENESIDLDDMIYGQVSINSAEQECDPVIIKSDGYPTYHFANIVDDHLMQISHVFRGVEWQVSTPKHIQLYKAFGWTPPKFGHLPLIVNKDGKKFSKRDGDVHVEYYKDQGYFSEAILNFITETGGGFIGRNQESIYSLKHLEEMFDINKLGRNSARLDFRKLDIINHLWLNEKLQDQTQRQFLISDLNDKIVDKYPKFSSNHIDSLKYISMIFDKLNYRVNRIDDLLTDKFQFLWDYKTIDSSEFLNINKDADNIMNQLVALLQPLSESEYQQSNIVDSLREFSKNHDIKFSKLMKIIRLSISGLKEGPSVGEMFTILGKEICISRLKNTVQLLNNQNQNK